MMIIMRRNKAFKKDEINSFLCSKKIKIPVKAKFIKNKFRLLINLI